MNNGSIDFLVESDKLRKSDWEVILRQTKETYKAQIIQLILTRAVISEIEQNLKTTPLKAEIYEIDATKEGSA